ncbi:MMPL family transporter [Demequina lutea]|uniref:RND superfamily putative drug exporter n=1 Tax=Demequina lutea TaxID=431489 RepID=A0A7Y9ZD60_9MICO|nr:MMPL family transporter [Demequina lutea]NYI41186.1 RND superfamily putative drug exporter [Demequina lutea]
MNKRPWLRPVFVVVMIVGWLAVGGVGGQTFGVLSSVQKNENSAFLPASAQSTEAAAIHAKFVPSDSVPGLFVITDASAGADLPAIQSWVDKVVNEPLAGDTAARTVGDILTNTPTAVPSQDGQAVLVVFSVKADLFRATSGGTSVAQIFADTVRSSWASEGLAKPGYLTGAAGIVADLVNAFAGIEGILLLVALVVVLVILLIVYRSPVLPFLVLATAMIALTGAIILVYALAKNGVITLNGQSQGIMFILVVGATTDYALLLVSRYREELLHHESPYIAMAVAWRRSLEPIAASAGTVILGLLVLLLSDLKSNASLGPAGAIGIAAALLAALTLLPALLLMGGKRARGVFWPMRPLYLGDGDDGQSTDAVERRAGVWGKISRTVDARPRIIWVGSVALLAVMATGLLGLKADGLGEKDVFLTQTESIEGFTVLQDHFAAGATSPVQIIVDQNKADGALAAVKAVPGIDAAYLLTPAVVQGAPAGTGSQSPIVVNGQVEIDAVTAKAASTRDAQQVVSTIREALKNQAPEALVGGQAAEALDTRLTTDRDIKVIIPVILLVIFIVLSFLLRALVAPALIVGANILSFAASLGVSSLVFDHVFHFPGMDPATPLLAFVFLVALGVDYSIFLMSRTREESLRYGTRAGVRRSLAVTGGVITSAGLVLAATFAALGVLPLIFLAQIAFIVGFGVLVDTFIVRSLLVPGLIADVDRASWWPWAGAFKD